MSSNLPARYWGSIFRVTYALQEKVTKNMKPGVLITNRDTFIILSENWQENVVSVQTGSVQANVLDHENKEVFITFKVSGKPVQYVHIASSDEKLDKLSKAISVETSKTAAMPPYASLPQLIPTFNFPMESTIEDFFKSMANVQSRFYGPFECGKPATMAFLDLLACIYRFRYDGEPAQEFETNADSLLVEVRRQFFYEWCTALVKAARFDPKDKNAYEYALRLVVGIAADIHVTSDALEVNTSDFFKAVGQFAERGDGTNLTPAVAELKKTFRTMFMDGYKETPPVNDYYVLLLTRILLILFCGNMISIYPIDIERFTLRAVDATYGLYTLNLPEENFNILRRSVDSFTNELLRFYDSRRYDPSFKYVFIAFSINDEIKKMKYEEPFSYEEEANQVKNNAEQTKK